MKELIEFLAKNIVENPDSVAVTEEEQNGLKVVKLVVHPDDMGRIIGREGKIIKAIRSLVKIKSLKENRKIFLELVPVEGSPNHP
jgi:predicted RNA-binding protein YlqC (UPF0109 family)